MRGEVRTKVVPLVATTYGFNAAGTPKAIRHNRELCELLKTSNGMVFKVCISAYLCFAIPCMLFPQDPKARTGLYETDLLQKAINIMWFTDAKDEGIVFGHYFNPIPLQTIALVFTAASPSLFHVYVYASIC
jgi:Domain of unknown function (DUF6532)